MVAALVTGAEGLEFKDSLCYSNATSVYPSVNGSLTLSGAVEAECSEGKEWHPTQLRQYQYTLAPNSHFPHPVTPVPVHVGSQQPLSPPSYWPWEQNSTKKCYGIYETIGAHGVLESVNVMETIGGTTELSLPAVTVNIKRASVT